MSGLVGQFPRDLAIALVTGLILLSLSSLVAWNPTRARADFPFQ